MTFRETTGSSGNFRSIEHGWDVFGADGEKVGDVAEVYGSYFTIEKGWLFTSTMYVPFSAVTGIEHDRVYLNATKGEIENRGWDQVPAEDNYDFETTQTGAYDRADVDTARSASRGRTDRDTADIELKEERLQADTHAVEKGRVRVHKDVVEERETLNVPVREEEVHIERRAVDRRAGAGQVPSDAFTEQDIEIPVYGEEVDVTKEAFVREEVEIDKTQRERQERVTDTVRREELHIDGEGTERVDDTPRR